MTIGYFLKLAKNPFFGYGTIRYDTQPLRTILRYFGFTRKDPIILKRGWWWGDGRSATPTYIGTDSKLYNFMKYWPATYLWLVAAAPAEAT